MMMMMMMMMIMMKVTGATLLSYSLPMTSFTRVSGYTRQCGRFTELVILVLPRNQSMLRTTSVRISQLPKPLYQKSDMDEAFKSPYCRIFAADLESYLLDGNFWGKQTHPFDPSRWCEIIRDKISSFSAFGSCPAGEEYGASMVGLIVGALLVGLQGEDDTSEMTWRLECRDPKVLEGLEAKDRLSLERNAYDDLILVGTR
jgi:hypothetical protein